MKIKKICNVIVFVCLWVVPVSADQVIWRGPLPGAREPATHRLWIPSDDPSSVFAVASQALYEINLNQYLNPVYDTSLPSSVMINDMAMTPYPRAMVYMATNKGLFEHSISANNWRNIFRNTDESREEVYDVIAAGDSIYCAAALGLYRKRDKENSWERIEGEFQHEPVFGLEADPVNKEYIYFAAASSVYRLNHQSKEVIRMLTTKTESMEETENGAVPTIKSISFHNDQIYIATTIGIYAAARQEVTAKRLTLADPGFSDITDFIVIEEEGGLVYLASTHKGVFAYMNGRWYPLYHGLQSNQINDLASNRESIYAATDGGVYVMNRKQLQDYMRQTALDRQHYQILKKTDAFAGEPTVRDVQEMAVRYADVSPDKVARWRQAMRKAAWYPQMDVGFNGGRDWDYSDSIFGTSSSGGSHYIAPDDKSWGEDFGWDISFSWDLSEVVWNTDETSIDSRSKLMVELREDVLDRVTRLYFERRRLQLETHSLPEDDAQRYDKSLRIDELTALLDGMTGGMFTGAGGKE